MMLQKMRDQTQGLGFKIVVIALIFVLAVFGFGAIDLTGGEPEVASVNGTDITASRLASEVQREQQRLAAQFGENFDPSLIDPAALQSQVLSRLIGQELLTQKAREIGVQASDTLIDDRIRANPNFQIDGRFDPETYRRTVRLAGFTPQAYRAEVERGLSLDQFSGAVTQTAAVPEWELRAAATFMNQTRDLAFLRFDPEVFRSKVEVTAEDVETYYEENRSQFMTELRLDAQALVLSVDDLLQADEISVDEAAIVAVYEADNEAAADNSELRNSSHILLRVTDERDDAAAAAELAALAEQIQAGADFAELASSVSEDPGSKLQGGSLGPVGRGVFDPAFEDALWALEEVGELSEPVKSAFGYHLIRLDGIEARPLPTLAERRDEIETQLRRDQAQELLETRARELDALAFENPDALTVAATQLGLDIEAIEGVTRDRGDGVFAEVAAREALFEPKVLDDGENSPAVTLDDDRVVVVRVAQRFDPEPQPLAQVREAIESQLLEERAAAALDAAFADARATLSDPSTSVSVVADELGSRWETFSDVARAGTSEVPNAVIAEAFQLPTPAAEGRAIGAADLPGGARALITVTAVRPGDWGALSEAERASLANFAANRAARLDFDGLYRSIEDAASVSRAINDAVGQPDGA